MIFHKNVKKTAISCFAFSLFLHAAGTAQAAALDVSQQPLMLVDSVTPNLIFTIDDSGSMRWAFVPDSMGVNDNAIRNTRRAKAPAFNPMYYNPEIQYLLPTRLNADGTEATTGYTTSFTAAYHNGFQTSYGSVNLSNSYRVSWNDDINVSQNYNFDSSTNYAAPTGRIFNLAENPGSDFRVQYNGTNNSATVQSSGGMSFTITRTTGGCTAVANFNGVPINTGVTCSRSSNLSTATLTRSAVPAYYYTRNQTSACLTNPNNEDCYVLRRVSNNSGLNASDERQNFAIWYSFYRNRALATLSAANLAFNELPPSVRFTWQSLGNCTTLNSANCNNNRFRSYSNRHKSNFFNWLSTLNFDQGTPLRASLDRAGKFLQTDAAWAANPNPFNSSGGNGTTVTNPVLSCRPSYHIMMTDGMWNGDNGSPTGTFRHDASSFTPSGGLAYNGTRPPYADATSNTLADLAMHYWATDLQPSIGNDLKPYNRFTNTNSATQYWDPRNNPATWQHMVNFTVGLALSNALDTAGLEWAGSTFAGTGYQNLLNGNRNWPAASASSDNNVYDLWHTAINSRGEFFSADNPEELVRSFQSVLGRIAERTSTASRPGISSSVSLEANNSITSRVFETSYDSTAGWAGDLVLKELVRQNNGSVNVTTGWSAASSISAQTSRNIFMAGSGSRGLQNFTWNNLNATQRNTFNINPDALGSVTDNKGSARVEFIRGVRTGEGTAANTFRQRTSVFGDIINSSPAIVGTATNVPYLMDRIDGDSGDYLAYLQATSRRPELVYVGANDGMLHAIHTKTGVGFTAGQEAFAFIPSSVIPNLPKLTAQSYVGGEHRFFVDGSPLVRDVYIDGSWRTVLIGTLRAGGKSLFALDITEPGIDGSGVKLLWEINNQMTDYRDLGYTFTRPEVTRLHSGQWGILLGNGYDSTNPVTNENDVAALFVIDIATGSLIRKLAVNDDSGLPNGLSSVRGADNNSDGVVDYAYAGDLQGNLWRFDLAPTGDSASAQTDPFARSSVGTVNPSVFKVGYGGQPLFKARASNGVVQPITAIPSLVRHPSRRGYVVMVGTGKYFETADSAPDTSKANSIYGVWDRYTRAQNTAASQALAERSNMEQRSITTQVQQTFNRTNGSISSLVRTISDGSIAWYNPNTTITEEASESAVRRRGWYLDLTVDNRLDGEMMINEMLVRGSTLLFSTDIPNDDPCADGLSSFVYGINAATGARTQLPPFDFNRDGLINSGDFIPGTTPVPPSGIRIGSPGGVALTRDGVIFGSDDSINFFVPPNQQGRQSWQYLPRVEDEE